MLIKTYFLFCYNKKLKCTEHNKARSPFLASNLNKWVLSLLKSVLLAMYLRIGKSMTNHLTFKPHCFSIQFS